MSEVLVAENVTRTLPGEVTVTLVEEVNVRIGRGEFVVIKGPSGSGKSSLLYLLGLLDRPTSGRLLLEGEDTSRFDEDRLATMRLEKLGFVFQFHFLLAEFSSLDNVLMPMRRLARLDPHAQRDEQRACCEISASEDTSTSVRRNSPGANASASPSLVRSPTSRW